MMNSSQLENFKSRNTTFLAGMMCGIAFGAVAALLLAPRRGVELRGQFADSMNRASRRARYTYDRATETVNDMAGRAVHIADNLADRAAHLTAKLNQAMSQKSSSTIS